MPPLPGPSPPPPPDVIVIGGGACGLAAAVALEAAGLDVLLLEGRTRLGGRAVASRGLDLGAQWIHGDRCPGLPGGLNPLAVLAEAAGHRMVRADYENARIHVGPSGAPMSEAREAAMEANWERVARAAAQRREPSLGARLEAALGACGLSASAASDVRHVIATEVEHEYGADVGWLSGGEWEEAEAILGCDRILPGSLAATVLSMRAGLRRTRVEEGAVVTALDYSGGGGGVVVEVASALGAPACRSLTARAAVLTVPLGVLQHSIGAAGALPRLPGAAAIALHPPLPPSHAGAIRALGMGLLNKVILEFPPGEALLPQGLDMLEFAAGEGAPRAFADILNLRHYSERNALVAFAAGSEALALSARCDEEVRAAYLAQLRAMLGAQLPEPIAFERTRWEADPFSCGSYSFLAPGATPAMRAQLAQPLAGRLWIAGEHTRVDYPSTVHGAMLAGREAAEGVIRVLESRGG